jgi:N6-L-threonylcarbamoyladenine synthase
MIFALETSCDETSVAILSLQGEILSHIIVNQTNHQNYGGVVPELASRAHLQILQSIVPQSLKEAQIKINDIQIFCATCGPGLIGGLLVGSTMAKSMAIGSNKPFYPINHLEGHLLSPAFSNKMKFPNLTLLLTGGHTQIYLVKKVGCYHLIGESIDDAIGESFDKVAKLLKLGYPGGPFIEDKASKGNSTAFDLPHPLEFEKNLNFSFSGIKTAVSLIVKKQNQLNKEIINDIAASFQKKIIEILEKRTVLALKLLDKKGFDIKDIAVVGGVAANKKINEALVKLSNSYNIRLISPPQKMCGDNAAMIAFACLQQYKKKKKKNIDFKPDPRWALGKIDMI